jgi:ADP-ribose pyrophosphatase YjhB (NUDIX family)
MHLYTHTNTHTSTHAHAGEDFAQAAIRETEEEAGLTVELTGVLRVEFTPARSARKNYCRMRVIFAAKPRDPAQMPKSVPDYEVREGRRGVDTGADRGLHACERVFCAFPSTSMYAS